MKKLWYEQAAKEWNEALPIGNGRLGAMIYGDVETENYQLNEDSVWYGGPIDRINPDAYPNLEKVRSLILENKIKEAENLLKYAFSGTPQSQRPYQTLGNLSIDFEDHNSGYKNYKRELSLNNAIHNVSYQLDNEDNVIYKRESFASYPDNIIVINLKTDSSKGMSFSCLLTRQRFYDHSFAINESTIAIDGNLGKDGIDFCTVLKARSKDGRVYTQGEHLIVENASEVTLILTSSTTFRYKKPLEECMKTLGAVEDVSYKELKERHVIDYKELYGRVSLELEKNPEKESLPTNQRLKEISNDSPDNGLIELSYQYGRYLLISSSRIGSLPANLQGIWNPHMMPPWDSKFTININTEMNYWPSLNSNLAECKIPLFDFLARLVESGRETARRMYNCRGFVAHHNTDIWADTAPQDIYIPATYWVMGGAWLSLHIWEYYLYTRDKKFLEEYFYILEEAALFFEDFLIPLDDYLVTCPSVSPENTYILPDGTSGCICAGASMDNQILRDLFNVCLEAGSILDLSQKQLDKYQDILNKIPPIKIGKHGQVMEWMEDYEEEEPGHRHISHLYALYPSNQITVDQTPELAKAAEKTIERRLKYGGGHTGWSMAWIINMYARLWNGRECYENLLKLLRNSTLPNLFGNHPPFQIDGNFGSTAAIVEMLVQSTQDRVVLLPALPKAWSNGRVSGIKLKGNLTLSMEWENGTISNFTLKSKQAYKTKVAYKKNREENSLNYIDINLDENSEFTFKNDIITD